MPGGTAQAWQLTAANAITRLADVGVSGSSFAVTLPPQSITLFVVATRRARRRTHQPPDQGRRLTGVQEKAKGHSALCPQLLALRARRYCGLPNLESGIATLTLTSFSVALNRPSSHENLYANGNLMPLTSR